MNIHDYVEKMKSIRSNILSYIDDDYTKDENYLFSLQ